MQLFGRSAPIERNSLSLSVSLPSIRNLHEFMRTRSDSEIFGRTTCPCTLGSKYVGVGGELRGNGFLLQVRNQHDTLNNEHVVRVRRESPPPSVMKVFDNSSFQDISRGPDVHPMFHIEIEASGEMSQDGVNLHLMFGKVDPDINYVVLEQEAGSIQWCNITDRCSTTTGSPEVKIPVKKSAKIWVIRIKKSLSSLVDALLALVHGQILFHVLVYYQFLKKVVKVRVIGISEELYQNPKNIRTAVTVAMEEKFINHKECVPKQLIKKGCLRVEFHKAGHRVSFDDFDIGRKTINKHAEWYDCKFDLKDLKDDLEVKVLDKEGATLCRVNLNEIFCDEIDSIERPVNQCGKPEITSFAEEVKEDQIPWLARQLNKDVEKVAMLLQIDLADVEASKQGEYNAEKASINILKTWLRCGTRPTWNSIKDVLESEEVRRFDIIRSLLNEDEVISDKILLWLMRRVASFYQMFARVLDVPDCEINMLSQGSQGHEEKCLAVLNRWRQRTRTPTVNHLIQALDNDIIEMRELAMQMKNQFLEDND